MQPQITASVASKPASSVTSAEERQRCQKRYELRRDRTILFRGA